MLTAKTRIDEAAMAQSDRDWAIATAEHQHLESQVQALAPDTCDTSFGYVDIAFRGFAQKTADEINQAARMELESQLEQGKNLLEAKKVLTRRKEYSNFMDSLSLTAAEAKKRLKLAEIFGDWDIHRLLEIASSTSLFTLCQSKYAQVVEQLREVPKITKELVLRLMKEVRDTQAKPKAGQQTEEYVDAVLQRHPHMDDGTFSWTLENASLSDKTGLWLEEKLETHTVGQVLEQAEEWEKIVQTTHGKLDDYTAVELELQTLVADVRSLQAENQKLKFQVEERDWRIAQLESQLLSSVPLQKNNDEKTTSMRFSQWEDVETAFNSDRVKLLNTVKNWSIEERQKLSKLLSVFLESEPEGLAQAVWVPENLLKSALQYLFFTVRRITGSNNLIDDPNVEQISGCRLVSLRDLGTRREHWVFQSPDGKQFPVYGRSEFSISRF